MIIRLEPEESSILTQIAQYTTDSSITPQMLGDLLVDASSDAHEIAGVLLGQLLETQVRPDVVETANFFRKWANQNVSYATSRSAAR